VTLDDLDLFDPDGPRPGAAPARKCKRHVWWLHTVSNEVVCSRCGTIRIPAVSRRSRNNRSRGNRDELTVARILGGRKVGELLLPWDVEIPGYARIQCKRLDRWPSLAKVIEWLDAIPAGPELRAVTLADTPGSGGTTRRLIVMDLDEYAAFHGRVEP
jgi:hypothetical protein